MISVLVSVGFWESSIGLSIDGSRCDYRSRPSVIPPAAPCIAETESCSELGLLLRDRQDSLSELDWSTAPSWNAAEAQPSRTGDLYSVSPTY